MQNSFIPRSLTKNYRQRPKYVKLLEHPFVVKSARSSVSVGSWYASLPISGQGTPSKAGSSLSVNVSNGLEAPPTPQPVRNYVTSAHHWTPEQVTPTPARYVGTMSCDPSTYSYISRQERHNFVLPVHVAGKIL